MNKYLKLLAASLVLVAVQSNAGTLKVGATPVPHSEILEFVAPMLKKEGVDLKVVEFNDYVLPNTATDDGSIDANFFQHRPYLQSFNADRNLSLVEVAGVHIEPMGIYSSKHKSLSELQDGAVISIPNDPTNGGRALLLAQKAGLIKLANQDPASTTVLDIVQNDKNIKFVEMESPLLPRSLSEVDYSIINTNFAMQANLNPLKDALFIEGSDSPYVNILVTTKQKANNPDIIKLVNALKSKECAQFIKDKYKGAVVPVND